MPGTSGIELVEALKARGAAIPIIVITGHADVPLAIQAMKAGVADFIEKPFDDEIMMRAIRRALTPQAGSEAARSGRHPLPDRKAEPYARELADVDGSVPGKASGRA